jgi:hypothetical protein
MFFKRGIEIFEKRFLVGDLVSIKASALGNNYQNDNGDWINNVTLHIKQSQFMSPPDKNKKNK